MKKILLLLLFLASCALASAQKYTVTGQLVDSLENPLPAATVLLLNVNDSSLVNFVVADNHGNFSFQNVAGADYWLKVTFMGYRPFGKLIQRPQNAPTLDLGKIRMEPVSNELEAIEITADKAPVTVKNDTIEFNAGSFNTRQHAVVEDLLKKLPGVEVDNDGNITSQGEQVRSVTVDGKPFFGRDPKLATRNLPADAVDKVQVFDKQSDQATFTGIDDGQREKTINLELKEEKRNAMFGQLVAGAGTDDRFQAKGNLNKFSKGQQLSFLGMGNNINQSGFGMEEYMNFTGNSRRMMGGGGVRIQLNADNTNGVPVNFGNRANGIMSTYAGGINVNNSFNKKTEVNGSYFYNYLDHAVNQTTLRENFLDDGNFTFNQSSRENNINSNHRANATLDHDIDSANTLRLTTSFTVNETNSDQVSKSENISAQGSIVSTNERQYFSSGLSTALNSNLLYRHKFDKNGRSLSVNAQLRLNENFSSGILNAENSFQQDNTGQILKQSHEQSTAYLSYGGTISYTEPMGNGKYLEANYNFRQNLNDVIKDVFNLNNGEATPDPHLSNRYNSHYEYHRAGLNFRITKSNYNLVGGTGFQKTYLTGELELAGTETSRAYQNVLPALRFNYNFSNTKHLRFDYETSVTEPDIQQLQPVIDNSDPLNVYIGNPELRPAYSQSWRINFTSFNPITFLNFFAFTDIDYTSNAIINAQYIDEHLARTIIPVNISSNLSINTHVNVGVPVKTLGSRFSLTGNFRQVNGLAMVNDVENKIDKRTAGGTLRYNYHYREIFDLSLSAGLHHQQTRYEFNQPDQTFINATYTAESNVNVIKNYAFAANLDYLVYENKSQDYDQRIPLLNLSFSRFLFKNKSGELKLSVNNLLDKALGVDQTSDINYIERVTTNSLGRYYMVSFTYSLNKTLNPMAGRRNGPMMRIMR